MQLTHTINIRIRTMNILRRRLTTTRRTGTKTTLVPRLPLSIMRILKRILVTLSQNTRSINSSFLNHKAGRRFTLITINSTRRLITMIIVTATLTPRVNRLSNQRRRLSNTNTVRFLTSSLLSLIRRPRTRQGPNVSTHHFLTSRTNTRRRLIQGSLNIKEHFLRRQRRVTQETRRLKGSKGSEET